MMARYGFKPIPQTDALRRAADMARMATDSMQGLNKIGYILNQYRVGLITEREAMERL